MLGEQIRVAGTSLSRLVGLLGKRGLEPGTGLLIIPSQAIHTVAMRFAIDVVFLDRDWRVIHLRAAMVPFRVTGLHWKARSVLGVACGGNCSEFDFNRRPTVHQRLSHQNIAPEWRLSCYPFVVTGRQTLTRQCPVASLDITLQLVCCPTVPASRINSATGTPPQPASIPSRSTPLLHRTTLPLHRQIPLPYASC